MFAGDLRPDRAVELVAGVTEQIQRLPRLVAEPGRKPAAHIVEDPENTHHRRRQDGCGTGLVVEADVAAGDRDAQLRAAVGQSAHGLGELPHDAGILGDPKLRQLVTATGVAPVTATLR